MTSSHVPGVKLERNAFAFAIQASCSSKRHTMLMNWSQVEQAGNPPRACTDPPLILVAMSAHSSRVS